MDRMLKLRSTTCTVLKKRVIGTVNPSMFLSSAPKLPKLQGVIFDMDGTLTCPNLDFKEMYSRCGVPLSEDLLTEIAQMPDIEQARANAVIEEMEAQGRNTLELGEGVVEFALWLKWHGIPTALVTRNTKTTVDFFQISLWEASGLPRLNPAVSRDSPSHLPAKPHPAAMHYILQEWGISLEIEDSSDALTGILMVGDSPSNDIGFGKAAMVDTALIDSGRRYEEEQSKVTNNIADFYVTNIAMLPHLLWQRYEIGGSRAEDSDHLHPNQKHPAPQAPETTLDMAAMNGNIRGVEEVLNNIEIDATHENNFSRPLGINSALIWAADGGHIECVKAIIKHCTPNERHAVLNHEGYLGATAVSRAARRGHAGILDVLLSAGASPDTFNKKRQAPLHFAAFQRHSECVNILLQHDANTLALDHKGRTPAEDTKDESIRQAILQARNKKKKRPQGIADVK